MMDAACPRLRDAVAGAHTQNPNIPFISNSTGNWITAVQATSPDYWAGQMRSSVRYSDGANVLLTAGHRVFLEVGPGTSLGTLLQYHANAGNTISIPTLRRVRRSEPETVLEAVGTLWAQGARVDWEALNRGERHHRVPLPTYPFESRRFWYGGNANQRDEADQPADQERKFGPTVSSEKPNRSQITAILSDIWKNLLATEEISPDEGFFELGGTSLMAAQLAVQIKQRLGLGLPLGVLIQAPTITKIAEFLEKAASEPQAWAPLVPIRTGGEGPSLFLVHGADANVLVYRELARLLNNVQVYGIQCLGADGQGEYHTDIPAMASYYIDELQSLQPHGPYLLGGFCMGGVIALEMAQQLAKKGERPNLVAMIETYNPRALKIRQNICFRSAFAVRNGYCHIVNWVLAHPRERVRYFVEKLLLEKARMKALFRLGLVRAGKAFGLNVGREYAHLEIGAINDRAYFAYDPHPYKGKLTVFRPKYDLLKWKRRDCGWSEIASEGVDIHVINTAAHGLLVHPFVSELSAEVLKAIHDAQES